METFEPVIRRQLIDRKGLLETALPTAHNAGELRMLLADVDAALEIFARGAYGICETCNDPIEPERLIVDPLVRHCLDHLTPEEQRALERDLDAARQVQNNLLPRQNAASSPLRSAYRYEPAGSVSGDYIDLIDTADHELYFFLGDISGKGVAASLLMSNLHALLRALAASHKEVDQLVLHANRLFSGTTLSTHFATMVAGRARPDGRVDVCNAGHCPPLKICAGKVEVFPTTAIPLGISSAMQVESYQATLEPGEALVLYSDGVTEKHRFLDLFESPGGTKLTNFGFDMVMYTMTGHPAGFEKATFCTCCCLRGFALPFARMSAT
jgi:phosphoserine phosphatase RsbU/P